MACVIDSNVLTIYRLKAYEGKISTPPTLEYSILWHPWCSQVIYRRTRPPFLAELTHTVREARGHVFMMLWVSSHSRCSTSLPAVCQSYLVNWGVRRGSGSRRCARPRRGRCPPGPAAPSSSPAGAAPPPPRGTGDVGAGGSSRCRRRAARRWRHRFVRSGPATAGVPSSALCRKSTGKLRWRQKSRELADIRRHSLLIAAVSLDCNVRVYCQPTNGYS